jgi:hypothetical protein
MESDILFLLQSAFIKTGILPLGHVMKIAMETPDSICLFEELPELPAYGNPGALLP